MDLRPLEESLASLEETLTTIDAENEAQLERLEQLRNEREARLVNPTKSDVLDALRVLGSASRCNRVSVGHVDRVAFADLVTMLGSMVKVILRRLPDGRWVRQMHFVEGDLTLHAQCDAETHDINYEPNPLSA
jgi:hypothetical protein